MYVDTRMSIYDRVAKDYRAKNYLQKWTQSLIRRTQIWKRNKRAWCYFKKVADLKATLEATLAEKAVRRWRCTTQGRLQRRKAVGLADSMRWQETVATLDEKILNLIGDVLLVLLAFILRTIHRHIDPKWYRIGSQLCRVKNTYQRRL